MARIRIAIIVTALLACAGCSRNTQSMLPRQLTGLWTTDSPRYQGRFLELYQTFVIIGTGPGQPVSVQMIDKVKTESMGDGTVLTIYSTDLNGTQYELGLQFSPANGGELRLRNQSHVWKREAARSR